MQGTVNSFLCEYSFPVLNLLVIPTLKQENLEFQVSLDNKIRSCFKFLKNVQGWWVSSVDKSAYSTSMSAWVQIPSTQVKARQGCRLLYANTGFGRQADPNSLLARQTSSSGKLPIGWKTVSRQQGRPWWWSRALIPCSDFCPLHTQTPQTLYVHIELRIKNVVWNWLKRMLWL